MIKVELAGGRKLAVAFSHPEYDARHIVTGNDGQKVSLARVSRKTVVEVFRILENGAFVTAAKVDIKVHHTDHFNRAQGRYLALKKLLKPGASAFNREDRKAIWTTYWDRANATHIEPPKAPPIPQTLAQMPPSGMIMRDRHQVVNRVIFN